MKSISIFLNGFRKCPCIPECPRYVLEFEYLSRFKVFFNELQRFIHSSLYSLMPFKEYIIIILLDNASPRSDSICGYKKIFKLSIIEEDQRYW